MFALVFCYYCCCMGKFFFFVVVVVVVLFYCCFLFSLLCFYIALLFVVFFFLTPNRFRFPNLDKMIAIYTGEIRIQHPRRSTGTIPTTTQNVPNKLYIYIIRTSTFRFSSQLPGNPTVAAVGLSGYISMLQWTSQGPGMYLTPLPALLSVTTNPLWQNSKPSVCLLT